MAMGPVEALVRHFKFQAHTGRDANEQDRLSDALAQTHLSSESSHTKPLPTLPPARTPSQFDHQRSNQLPHSLSFQSTFTPEHGTTSFHKQQAPRPLHPYHPTMLKEGSRPIHKERPQSVSIDYTKQPRLVNPWELIPSLPASSLPPSLLTPSRPVRPVSAPALPTPPTPTKRSKNVVTDSLQRPGWHQCWGIKRDGTRCTRKIGLTSPTKARSRTPSKSPSPSKGRLTNNKYGSGSKTDPLPVSDSEGESSDDCCEDDEDDDDDERRQYCHQHSKEINKTPGFILPGSRRAISMVRSKAGMGDGLYVDFELYLGKRGEGSSSSEENRRAKLRTAMCQPPSEVDWLERGYIYIYELRDRSTNTHIALKVGRARNVFKRIEQWRSQCQSKSPLLRAFFPRPYGVAQDVLPGAANVVEKGTLLSHKWERLCHIDLSSLGKRLNEKCNDCGSRHREIFLLPREIGFDGARTVVERWLSFVRVIEEDGVGSVMA
ncbi:hypothetical protein CBS101457_005790 [Exobasidium rhododendri]|nr:hypothetical protein CBS101457_005790 [Exobasidium rhododendri]